MLESTLIVMAGIGPSPKITICRSTINCWPRPLGRVQMSSSPGGGICGAQPSGRQTRSAPGLESATPENMAATIYRSLGLPDTVAWHDDLDRPHHVYFMVTDWRAVQPVRSTGEIDGR